MNDTVLPGLDKVINKALEEDRISLLEYLKKEGFLVTDLSDGWFPNSIYTINEIIDNYKKHIEPKK